MRRRYWDRENEEEESRVERIFGENIMANLNCLSDNEGHCVEQ